MTTETMTIVIQVDCQIRVQVPWGGRSQALTQAETRLHSEFAEFSRHLVENGYDAFFRVNERAVRRAPERRFSPVDIELPMTDQGIEYERRWDKRAELQDERHTILELLSKPPTEGAVDEPMLRMRLKQIESLLREPPA